MTNSLMVLHLRIIQHEVDHLNGITFIKRANRFHLQQAQKQLKLSKRNKKEVR